MRQSDHFFEAPLGRLKLRQGGDGRAELIGYVREDIAAAKGSDYYVYATGAADELMGVLAHCLGSKGVVSKTRTLLLWRNTRIHLDEVDDLGTFVELETVVHGQDDGEARGELGKVADALGLGNEALVPFAYLDLLVHPRAGICPLADNSPRRCHARRVSAPDGDRGASDVVADQGQGRHG
jgi:adenylate cyclase class IV